MIILFYSPKKTLGEGATLGDDGGGRLTASWGDGIEKP
jgi:hypothetical protein